MVSGTFAAIKSSHSLKWPPFTFWEDNYLPKIQRFSIDYIKDELHGQKKVKWNVKWNQIDPLESGEAGSISQKHIQTTLIISMQVGIINIAAVFLLVFVHIFISYWVMLLHHNIPYCVVCSKQIVDRFLWYLSMDRTLHANLSNNLFFSTWPSFRAKDKVLMARHDPLFERFTLSNEHINFFSKLLSWFASEVELICICNRVSS